MLYGGSLARGRRQGHQHTRIRGLASAFVESDFTHWLLVRMKMASRIFLLVLGEVHVLLRPYL